MVKKLLVGRILKVIGLTGLVKIQSYMSSVEIFLKQSNFFDINDRRLTITNLCHLDKDKFSGLIYGIDNRNDADKFRMTDLYVEKSALAPLSDNEYYFEDLKNMSVFDETDVLLGTVKIVLDYGAGPFLEILPYPDSANNQKVATIPFSKDAILDVNLDLNKVIIDKNYLLQ